MVGDDLADDVLCRDPPAHAVVGPVPSTRLGLLVDEVVQGLPQRHPRALGQADEPTACGP